MFNAMNKVVKCKNKKCELHFMYTEKDTKCPFCKTEYGEAEEKTASSAEASAAKKDKKEVAKTQKGFFKLKIRSEN